MVSIQYQPPQQPKEKPKTQYSVFHSQGGKESPYIREDKALTWLELEAEIGSIMAHKGLIVSSKADFLKKLPALIFTLLEKIDELTAQLIEKPKGKK